MKLRGCLTLFLILAVGFSAQSEVSGPLQGSASYQLDKSKSKLEFVAATTRFEVLGTFSDWDVIAKTQGNNLADIKIEAKVNTKSLDTNDAKRDKHLRTEDFFFVDKYPYATFESREITDAGNGNFLVEGQLNFLGHRKGIRFNAKLEDGHRVRGEFVLNRQDFGMSYTSSFFVSLFSGNIKDEVRVRFDLFAIKKD